MPVAFNRPLLLVVILLACGGCHSGPRLEQVWGTVSYDGQPIENGTIEFVPVSGTTGPSMGASIVAGRFDVPAAKGARAGGTYKVVITAIRKSGKTVPNIFKPGEAPLEIGEQFVPPRYNTESTLTITISEDAAKNEQHFELEAPATAAVAK